MRYTVIKMRIVSLLDINNGKAVQDRLGYYFGSRKQQRAGDKGTLPIQANWKTNSDINHVYRHHEGPNEGPMSPSRTTTAL